ncbi:MAG: amino acid ABC transporter permease [Ruminococcaceae bacterium]|nr:amino acid ABC transporter permease [Oscillospiraceae bacterium]
MFDKIINGFVKTFIAEDRYKLFLEGFKNTILIALVATLIGVVIGAIVAIIRVFHKQTGKLFILDKICEIYTTIIRGTPVVVQLLITYNIIFAWSTQAVLIGMIGFGLNSGAYVAEIMRGGINAVDIGQTEAGRSLGLSSVTTMKSIVLPQAIKNVLPAIGNEFISLLKETSVIGFLGVIDLTKAAERVISRTMNVYFPYISIALVYLAVVYGLNYLFKKLEKRLAKSDR